MLLSAEFVKSTAIELGFSACGVCRAAEVDNSSFEEMQRYVSEGRNADMHYLERNLDLRRDPRLLTEGTKSIVSVALNYYPRQKMESSQYTLSYYAYGKDYHDVVKKRLEILLERISEHFATAGERVGGRAFCDTAPVLERYWAWQAGIGFIGKNTLLTIPHKGSFFFLGELFLDCEFDFYDEPLRNKCGACTRCIDACPAGALYEPFRLDARRCLSYLTIENRNELPEGTAAKMQECIYGCDRCQNVCPHNSFASATSVEEFTPSEKLLNMKRDGWHSLTQEQYSELFKGSAVKRAKYSGLMRNIAAAEQNNGKEEQ